MNEIKLAYYVGSAGGGTINLLDGPYNFFKGSCGTRPSFGIFRCTGTQAAFLAARANGEMSITFSCQDLAKHSNETNPAESDKETITIKGLWFVRASPVETSSVGYVPEAEHLYELILADERVLWLHSLVHRDYNTYPIQRIRNKALTDFTLENLKDQYAGTEWTWADLLTEINAVFATTTTIVLDSQFTWPVAWNPRNIIGQARSICDVLDDILRACHAYLAVDFTKDRDNGRYSICALGGYNTNTRQRLIDYCTDTQESRIVDGGRVYVNDFIRVPGCLRNLFPMTQTSESHWPSETSPIHFKEIDINLPVTAYYGVEELISSHAVCQSGTICENSAALAAIAAEQATRFMTSFSGNWSNYKFAGFPSDLKLDASIHEITWQANAQGAFTSVRLFRPSTPKTIASAKEVEDQLFSYGKFLLPPCVQFASVIAVTKTSGVMTRVLEVDAALCDSNKEFLEGGRIVYLKASGVDVAISEDKYPVGFLDIAVDDVVAWVPLDGRELNIAGKPFDGQIIPFAGKNGALLTAEGPGELGPEAYVWSPDGTYKCDGVSLAATGRVRWMHFTNGALSGYVGPITP